METLQLRPTPTSCTSNIDSDIGTEKLPGKVKIFPIEDKDPTPLLSCPVSDQDMGEWETKADEVSSPGGSSEVDDSIPLLSRSASDHDTEMEHKESSDESSPREVVEDTRWSLESETSSPKASTSESEASTLSGLTAQWRGFFSLWRQRSMRHLLTFPSLGGLKFSRSNSRGREKRASSLDFLADTDCCRMKPSWKNFSMEELRAATENFNSENLVGKGGYGEVYKGRLKDGRLVAVKRLNRGTMEERIDDFLSELGIIVHINHRNAAKLIGLGIEGGMHIVLKLSQNGSLASLLHGSKEKLNWSIRYKVALGTAEGLWYLHEICQRRIIHRDIKAANILLTKDFEPQICDFGLAKWLPDNWTHHIVPDFEGTFGYIAPECLMHGIVDEKTDVYAYGVLLLEIITGRTALDSSQQSLVMWATPLLVKNDIRRLVDPSLAGVYNSQQLERMVLAASLCIQQTAILRPRMSQIVELLKGESSIDSMKLKRKPILERTYSDGDFETDASNSSKYRDELNRHRQLALEI